jgi:hypothetical protein
MMWKVQNISSGVITINIDNHMVLLRAGECVFVKDLNNQIRNLIEKGVLKAFRV